MGLTGDFAGLRKLERDIRELGTPGSRRERSVLATVRRYLKPEIGAQYLGASPAAGGWSAKKGGGQAYQSRKMASAIKIPRILGGLKVVYLISWLKAADEGHRFPPRLSNYQVLTFDKNGRLISKRRQQRARLVFDVEARGHIIGGRVLPPRPQYPRGHLPGSWRAAIARGFREALDQFHLGSYEAE